MPKYSITNAQFSPFSFEEMVRPYQLATEKYEKQVDTFNKLAEDIDAVDYLAQSLPDESPYKKQFNAYVEQFNKAGDTLSQGWSPDTASNLMNLRRMYHNTLVPIQKADQIRTKTADTQNAMRAKDPTVRFEVDATDPNSLEYFLSNPGTPAIKSYSQNAILQSAASQIKNLKEQLYQNNSFEALGEEGKLLAQNALSQEDVAKIIQNPELYPNISSIINTAIDASGLSNWSDTGKEQEASNAWNTALSGMSLGLSVAENPNFIPAQKQEELAIRRMQANTAATRSRRTSGGGGGSRGPKSTQTSNSEFQVNKGDTTRVDDQKIKAKIEAAGYEPLENRKLSGDGKVLAPNGAVGDATREGVKPVGSDVVKAMYSGHTYEDYARKAAIANITGGYLDAFIFKEGDPDANGNRSLYITSKNVYTVGSYYNYAREGYNASFKFAYNKKKDFEDAVAAISGRNAKDPETGIKYSQIAREKGARDGKYYAYTYKINSEGLVEVDYVSVDDSTKAGKYIDPSEIKAKPIIQPIQQDEDEEENSGESVSTSTETANNTGNNVRRLIEDDDEE